VFFLYLLVNKVDQSKADHPRMRTFSTRGHFQSRDKDGITPLDPP